MKNIEEIKLYNFNDPLSMIEEYGLDTVEGIVCNKCGKTLPQMFARDHLDSDFPVNKCPHTPIYEIKDVDAMDLKLYSFKRSEIPLRLYRLLVNNKINTTGDLVQKSKQDLLKLKFFGRKYLVYVNKILESIGLSLRLEETDEEKEAHLKEYQKQYQRQYRVKNRQTWNAYYRAYMPGYYKKKQANLTDEQREEQRNKWKQYQRQHRLKKKEDA